MKQQAFVHRNLPRLLLQAREAVMTHTRPSLREHGLSDQQWRVLRVLAGYDAVETGRVAREAYVLGPSLTGVLARMERVAWPSTPRCSPPTCPRASTSSRSWRCGRASSPC